MPELPEVETIRQGLCAEICGKKIERFEALDRKVIEGKDLRALAGEKIVNIARRGKLLIFKLSSRSKFLLIHLKMTGQLLLELKNKIVAGGHNISCDDLKTPRNKHTRAIFHFAPAFPPARGGTQRGGRLFFNDMRRFGYIKIVNAEELKKILGKYGPEPLGKDFTLAYLSGMLKKTGRSVKAALLDQEKIAGIGNIYADEACFCARVKPSRRASSLSPDEAAKLHGCIKQILALAIKHRGTTFSDYRDCDGQKGCFIKFLKVYDRKGEKCLRCKKGIIQKKKIAGRGSVFCPNCQK